MCAWCVPPVHSVTEAISWPAVTLPPSTTPFGSTWRKTQTLPSAPCTFTVPPKTWPVLPLEALTSTIVPSIGERTGAPAFANRS